MMEPEIDNLSVVKQSTLMSLFYSKVESEGVEN